MPSRAKRYSGVGTRKWGTRFQSVKLSVLPEAGAFVWIMVQRKDGACAEMLGARLIQ